MIVLISLIWITVWTPTFDGNRRQRFIQANIHYAAVMGLRSDFYIEIIPYRMKFTNDTNNGAGYCAWVRRRPNELNGFELVGMSTDLTCLHLKPEYLALHEQCHRRYAHLDVNIPKEQENREMASCMIHYGPKKE